MTTPSPKIVRHFDTDGRYRNPAARGPLVVLPPAPPVMHLDTGPHLQAITLAKLNSGPDQTEAALRISDLRYADFGRLHDAHRVDALGAPALRDVVLAFLDGAYAATEMGHARQAALEALRTHEKRSHRRAFTLLMASYGGMTQADIAATAGAGGRPITQSRVSQILRSGMLWTLELAEQLLQG